MPEEASIEHFPAVCIRTSTERPEAIDKGSFVLGNIDTDSVLQSVYMTIQMAKAENMERLYQIMNLVMFRIQYLESFRAMCQ